VAGGKLTLRFYAGRGWRLASAGRQLLVGTVLELKLPGIILSPSGALRRTGLTSAAS
jgi:hypothetical protein